MAINVDNAFDIDQDGLAVRDNDGNILYYLCAGSGLPDGNAAPQNTFYFNQDTQLIHYKYGAGNNDWRQLRADDIAFDDTNAQLGASNVKEAIDTTKTILDALPDAMPALQGNFLTIGSVIPTTWTTYPLQETIATQTSVIDINPGANTQVRLKETGTYYCYYSFGAFAEDNPLPAEGRVIVNGIDSAILGSESSNYGSAGNNNNALNLDFNFHSGFLYTATANDYLELQAQGPILNDYTLTLPVAFVVVKLDAQFANFMINGDSDKSRADLLQGGISELVSGANQTVTGVATTIINWNDQDLFDSDCFTHTPGDSEITLDKAGRYRITSKVNVQRTANGRVQPNAFWQSSTGGGGFIDIDKSYSHAYTRSSDASNFGSCTAAFTYDAVAGDKLRCGVFNNEAAAVCNILDVRTNFIIEYIGENP